VPTLLALLTGIGSLVPIVGMKIVYFPMTVILIIRTLRTDAPLWFPVVFFVVTLVIVDTIPDFIVRAYVSGRGFHFGLVMFAYILGVVFFGWYGLFLGPIVLVLFLHFMRIIFPQLVSGEQVTS
jgi:predicted PurR-regulated permease PerM